MWSRARSFTAATISVESKGQWFCCMIQQTHDDEHKTKQTITNHDGVLLDPTDQH